ncbi:crotonase/enoyl-CoA hydratase family protein [Pseudorhodoferax sp. Leaf274]|uniref:crotonase/enoyl-CoA hydratase family protein n=1 Tax=Pseudorhodoferax sp. Leaf274 TaxID=1736318 RepID=UPI00070387CB|nr:crotonase/enoyl-CoA hydratase family protein [Pseudorhodoferax sp. Leaf274]KQP49175.1 enoyl-CoA hydratase [Pseudorhodoferax sp. Leaf274]
MTEPLLIAECHGDIAVLKLNRADKRNAINDALIQALGAYFSAPPRGARVVVLHGEGAHFCAGLDLVERMANRSQNPLDGLRHSRGWHRVFDLIQHGEVPVISVLKGGVIGGGLELAAATHVRVSEASTFYQLPEGQRGIFVGGGAAVRVPRIIGAGRMVEMMLTGRRYSAAEGQSLGMSHYTVDDGAGLARALELAAAVASNAEASNYAIINGISRIADMPAEAGLFAESMVASMTGAAANGDERIAAFFAQRRQARQP